MSALVLVLLGTDHHPFDRLVDWADDAARRHPRVRFVVQHGASRAPSVAEGFGFLPQQEIVSLLGRAATVVCHGGPGTIMDARRAGHVPLCVPRDPALGEHVDGHQQRFAALVHRAGVVHRVDTRRELEVALDESLAAATGRHLHAVPTSPVTEEARGRLAHELDTLLGPRPGAHRAGRHEGAGSGGGR